MRCPNCGTENTAEGRYCVKCAYLLEPAGVLAQDPLPADRPQGGFDYPASPRDEAAPIDFDSFEKKTAVTDEGTGENLWPQETVFVLGDEIIDDVFESADLAEMAFEDDLADDVFEQSLSGLRISDITGPDAVQVTSEKTSQPGSEPIPESEQWPEPEVKPEAEREPEYTLDAEKIVARSSQIGIVPEDKVIDHRPRLTADVGATPDSVDPRRWPQLLLRVVGLLLLVALSIGAGIIGTLLHFELLPGDLPAIQEYAVEVEEPGMPVPPPGMAYVPGGEFYMGSDTGDEFSRPAHKVSVGPFFIDLTEVTNESYSNFVRATGHDAPPNWIDGTYPEGRANFPVTGVSWYDAAGFAAWAGKRLPTEAEWEFAARGTDGRIYPWGNDWESGMANADPSNAGLRNVGEGGQSPFGLFDMSGNAWEWTSSDARPYPGGEVFPRSRLRLKIIRGGNWKSNSTTASAVFRGYYGAGGERNYDTTSFRCVQDVRKD
jgi:formylglycine-generating enzyme required for sulfatase activity